MTNERKTFTMLTAERAFKQTLRDHQIGTREREAAEDEAATEAKIARLREARQTKEAAERKP